jgi:hypothetical protein
VQHEGILGHGGGQFASQSPLTGAVRALVLLRSSACPSLIIVGVGLIVARISTLKDVVYRQHVPVSLE